MIPFLARFRDEFGADRIETEVIQAVISGLLLLALLFGLAIIGEPL